MGVVCGESGLGGALDCFGEFKLQDPKLAFTHGDATLRHVDFLVGMTEVDAVGVLLGGLCDLALLALDEIFDLGDGAVQLWFGVKSIDSDPSFL